ncbi:MAG: SDR family NAD(P)-dependent oxidoreductase [Chitinophagaceae bacterium]|nr:MAG: SDR family NAD(P)-dependent oxidoreductase [Chitinophagaceae bacterium]
MKTEQRKIALVTGANTGVGFQIAKALTENNYIVLIGARNIEKGKAAASDLGDHAHAIELDVTSRTTIDKASAEIQNKYGKLDLLVNNAGISNAAQPGKSLEEILAKQKLSTVDVDEMRTVWETNVFGVVSVTQAFLPLLQKSNAARIVNVSSGLGSLTLNMNPENPYRQHYTLVYGASKAAMNAVTVALAIELEPSNIKVSAVSPGFTATALNNFQGTDTVEEGSKEPVRVALDESGVSGRFTGPGQTLFPW